MKIKDLVFLFLLAFMEEWKELSPLRVIFDYLIAITSPFFSEGKYPLCRKADIISSWEFPLWPSIFFLLRKFLYFQIISTYLRFCAMYYFIDPSLYFFILFHMSVSHLSVWISYFRFWVHWLKNSCFMYFLICLC